MIRTPNSWKYQLWYPYMAEAFKMILMAPGFVFDQDLHTTYADVSADELPTENGFTAGGLTLSGIARSINLTDDRCEVVWNNGTWTASGG